MITSNKNSNSITITNCGPVDNLVIPVQPGGTIVKGYCGKGKSIVLEAIALGLGSHEKGRVSPREGTKRGEVEVCGVLLGVNASRITRNGESEVVAQEEFSLGELIDPPHKETDARNRYGIKSLLRMSDSQAEHAKFYDLLGGKESFDAIVAPDAIKSSDLVDMAMRIKKALESKARDEEAAAEREEGKAAADRNAADGLDLNAEDDPKTLQAAYKAAIEYHTSLVQKDRSYRDAEKARKKAEETLAKSAGKYTGPTVEQATASVEKSKKAVDEKDAEINRLIAEREKLNQAIMNAQMQHVSAQQIHEAAADVLSAAQAHEKALADANAALNLTLPPPIDKELIDMAADDMAAAHAAMEQAAVVRAAKARIAQAKEHQHAATEHRKKAAHLRIAGKATDDVLSQAVASTRFSVASGVLMGHMPDGRVKPYYALSDGERTMIACEEKLERARAVEPEAEKLAIIDLPQRVAQDLPPSVMERLFSMAAEKNACIVTALVDDGELRAEPWVPRETMATGGASNA